jgi:hypothetical protein
MNIGLNSIPSLGIIKRESPGSGVMLNGDSGWKKVSLAL